MNLEEALKTLGLTGKESPDEIRSRFRYLARKWHPDPNPDDPEATKKMRELLDAYETLRKTPAERGSFSFSSKFDRRGFFWTPHMFSQQYAPRENFLGNLVFTLQCGGHVYLSPRGQIGYSSLENTKSDIFKGPWTEGLAETVPTWDKDEWGGIQTELELLTLKELDRFEDWPGPGRDYVPNVIDPHTRRGFGGEADYLLHGQPSPGDLELHFDAELLFIRAIASVGQQVGRPLFEKWATRFQEPGRENRFNLEGTAACYDDINRFLLEHLLVNAGFVDRPDIRDFAKRFGDTVYPTTLNVAFDYEEQVVNRTLEESIMYDKTGMLWSDLAMLCGFRNFGVTRDFGENSHFSDIYSLPTGDGGLDIHFKSDCEIRLGEDRPTLREGGTYQDKKIADRLIESVEESKDAIVEAARAPWEAIKDHLARSLHTRQSDYVFRLPKEDVAFIMTLLTEPHITYLEGPTQALPWETS